LLGLLAGVESYDGGLFFSCECTCVVLWAGVYE
jgi:hypothetical protein